MINPAVDQYMIEGCGRCSLGGTPACKVHQWVDILQHLRGIILSCEGYKEERKWGSPTYTFQDNNVVMLGAFKDNCVLSFLKGALIKDEHQLLVKPGENTQSARVIRFTDLQQVIENEHIIKDFLQEAIEIEKAGLKYEFKKNDAYEMPEELEVIFEEAPDFKTAFYALTPGRQRGYLLHFGQPKQSQTRTSRIEKSMSKIFEGKGMQD